MLMGGSLQITHPRMEEPGMAMTSVHRMGQIAEEHT